MPGEAPLTSALRGAKQACQAVLEDSKKAKLFMDDCGKLAKVARRIQVWLRLAAIVCDWIRMAALPA